MGKIDVPFNCNCNLKNGYSSQSGSVLIEATICLPLLIFLLLSLFEVSRLCETYLKMNQVIREVIMTAGRVEQYPESTLTIKQVPFEEADHCNLDFTKSCIIRAVNWRVHRLIESKKIPVDQKSVKLTLEYDVNHHSVRTTIESSITPFFRFIPFFNFKPLRQFTVTESASVFGAKL